MFIKLSPVGNEMRSVTQDFNNLYLSLFFTFSKIIKSQHMTKFYLLKYLIKVETI